MLTRNPDGRARFGEVATLVLVEDDEGHAILIERTLRRFGFENDVVHCRDGGEAVDFFFTSSPRAKAMAVLLDLNLPILGGLQILERLKSDPRTCLIPVIVLTTSENPTEIERSYQLGASGFVTKPVDYERFGEAIRSVARFLTIITLPPVGGAVDS